MWNSQQPITDMEGAVNLLCLGFLIIQVVASQAPNYGSHFVPGAVSVGPPIGSMGGYNASPIQSPGSPHQTMEGHGFSSYVPGAVS